MDPLPTPALAAVSSAPHLPYADSIESSPRSRTTDSWDDPLPPVPGAPKLRLMCSYGGRIVPRPHDKSLCYVGGDTRMVFVDRSISLADLSARLAKTLLLRTKPFSLKYQLPNEDLDSLISLADDEDLDNMIEEYDRICAAATAGGKGSRLRIFVFPAKSESIASIGSLLDNSVKSDEWFLSALNGSRVLADGFSNSTSVNYLLGLENDVVVSSTNELGISRALDSGFGNGKNFKAPNQDVHSVPDSPMMETTSSFGSTNSTPSLANLHPIRVSEDDGGSRGLDSRLGIEEQFAQINFSTAENFAAMSSPPPIPTTIIASMSIPSTVTSSAPVAGDFPSKVVSDDERSDHGAPVGLCRKPPQQQPQSQVQPQQMLQKPCVNLPKPDSLPSDGSLLGATPQNNQMGYQEVTQVSSGENTISANQVDQRNNYMDPSNARIQLQKQVQDSGYMDPNNARIQLQQQPQNCSYQQQFVQAGTHYVIQQPGNPMAMPAYYPVYPPHQQAQHPHHQPIQFHAQQYPHPVYIVQAPQPPQAYNTTIEQPTYPDGTTVVHTGHPQTPPKPNRLPESANAFSSNPNVSRAAPPNPEGSSAIYKPVAVAAQPMVQLASKLHQQQFLNYSQVNQPRVISAPSPTYRYEIPDPARAQIYFTQPLDPSLITQYQTMASAQGIEASIQPQNDSMEAVQVRNL